MVKARSMLFRYVIIFLIVTVFLGVSVVFVFHKKELTAPNKEYSSIYAMVDSKQSLVGKITKDGLQCEQDTYFAYCETALKEAEKNIAGVQKISVNEGAEQVMRGGFDIYICMDTTITGKLDEVYGKIPKTQAQSAMVITDINGSVLAMKGNINKSDKNYATMGRSAGSSIKPISIYAPLIDLKLANWSTQFMDSPVKKVKDTNGDMVDWPQNASNTYSSQLITVSEGIERSLNTIAVRALDKLTVKKSIDFLGKFDIDISSENKKAKLNEDDVKAALALGYFENGISPYQMAGCYQIFANGGQYTAPYCVDKILYNGNPYYKNIVKPKRVIRAETATILNRLMQNVVKGERGTAKSIDIKDFEVAGKTGTSSNNKDRWFVGITPYYVGAVWWGYDDDVMHDEKSNQCLPIFSEVMNQIETNLPQKTFTYSPNVLECNYCADTGELATPYCRLIKTGYFEKGYIPETCHIHRKD